MSGVIEKLNHADLGLLSADDHSQYPLSVGRAGGQTLVGGTDSAENLTLSSTTHGTKGFIYLGGSPSYFDEAQNNLILNNLCIVGSGIEHRGDSDTSIRFLTDRITMNIGGAVCFEALAGEINFYGHTLVGNNTSGGDLTLQSTSHATEGKIIFGVAGNSVYDEVNDRLGIGITDPAQKFEIGSNDNSKRISIYHDNLNGYISQSDGNLTFLNTENNVNNQVLVKGAGTGVGIILLYDENDAERLQLMCINSIGYLRTTGGSPGNLSLQDTAPANVTCFVNAVEGKTRYFQLTGFEGGGDRSDARMGVGVHTNKILSFYSGSNALDGFYFEKSMSIGKAPFEAWQAALSVFQLGGNAAISADTAEGTNKNLYITQNAYNDNLFKAITTDQASMYQQEIGKHRFFVSNGNATEDVQIIWINPFNINNNGSMEMVNQNGVTSAILQFQQLDVDEPFTKLIGTAAAADLTRSLVDNGDVTTATLAAWEKVEVQDDGNQITDQDYFRPLYTLA